MRAYQVVALSIAASLATSVAVRTPAIASSISSIISVFGQVGAVDFPVTGTDTSTPANPGAGKTKLYPKNGSYCSTSTSAGENCMIATSGLISGQAPQYTFRSGFYYPVQGGTSSPVNIIQTNGTESGMPFFVPTTTTFTRMAVWVVTAGSAGAVARFGIYQDNGGRPGNLVLDGGTAATTSSGAVAEVTISQSLTPGKYWVSCVPQGAPVTGATFQFYLYNSVGVGYDTNTEIVNGAGAYSRTGITGALTNWSGTATTAAGIMNIALKTS
jgi:hypothetical protein